MCEVVVDLHYNILAIATMPTEAHQENGDVSPISHQSNEASKSHTNGKLDLTKANGRVVVNRDHDLFQHLSKPQQDVLLLHGPRQKYSLQTTGQIPELRAEREILVQVC